MTWEKNYIAPDQLFFYNLLGLYEGMKLRCCGRVPRKMYMYTEKGYTRGYIQFYMV